MEARAERRAEIAEDRLRGRLLDPEASKPGHKKVKGRTRGSKIAYKGTHKPAEAPTLRRDPPAYEKMALMRRWERAAEERGCSVKGLPSEDCSASSNSAKLVLVVPQLITGTPAMSVVLSGDESRFRDMHASSAPVSNKAKEPRQCESAIIAARRDEEAKVRVTWLCSQVHSPSGRGASR